jgi:hypothetical protein
MLNVEVHLEPATHQGGEEVTTTNKARFCTSCGKPEGKRSDGGVPFRSSLALKCKDCDKETAEERREYHRDYHRARNSAIGILIEKHPREFERLLAQERVNVDQEKKRAEKAEAAAA